MQPSHSQSKYLNSSSTPVALGNVQSSHRYSLEKLKEFEAKLLLQGHSIGPGTKSTKQTGLDRGKMNFADLADATVYGMTKTAVILPTAKHDKGPVDHGSFNHTTHTPQKLMQDMNTRN